MSEIIINPPLLIELKEPPKGKWEKERDAFSRMLPDLLKTHRGKFVAVHEERVVDSGDDLIALALGVWDKYGYVPIYVDLVTDQAQPPARIPHYRTLSEEISL